MTKKTDVEKLVNAVDLLTIEVRDKEGYNDGSLIEAVRGVGWEVKHSLGPELDGINKNLEKLVGEIESLTRTIGEIARAYFTMKNNSK